MIAVIAVTIIATLIVNEFSDICPWLADKLVRWSAPRRYKDPDRAQIRAEELAALIKSRPGNLFKLITGLGFAATAIVRSRAARRQSRTELFVRQALAGIATELVFSERYGRAPRGWKRTRSRLIGAALMSASRYADPSTSRRFPRPLAALYSWLLIFGFELSLLFGLVYVVQWARERRYRGQIERLDRLSRARRVKAIELELKFRRLQQLVQLQAAATIASEGGIGDFAPRLTASTGQGGQTCLGRKDAE